MSIAHTLSPVAEALTVTRRDRCLFRARELSDTTVLVAPVGEIDATNAQELLRYVQESLKKHHQLVLDLSRVTFFSISAFPTLSAIDTRLTHGDMDWVMVPSPEVSRVIRVCDRDGTLPTAANIVSAVAGLARGVRRLYLAAPPL
jgi:anti-anti-sigma factor